MGSVLTPSSWDSAGVRGTSIEGGDWKRNSVRREISAVAGLPTVTKKWAKATKMAHWMKHGRSLRAPNGAGRGRFIAIVVCS